MSYDSFDGGSHGTHQWRAVGYEKIDYTVRTVRPIANRGTATELGEPDLRHYVVRACELCPEVWFQQFDPVRAVT
jgi:hypothetical protein